VNEKRRRRIVKDNYDTDYFIIDKFPRERRPFYAMPDPDPFEFVPMPLLIEKMKAKGIDPLSMQGYVQASRRGCSPYVAGGIGKTVILLMDQSLGHACPVQASKAIQQPAAKSGIGAIIIISRSAIPEPGTLKEQVHIHGSPSPSPTSSTVSPGSNPTTSSNPFQPIIGCARTLPSSVLAPASAPPLPTLITLFPTGNASTPSFAATHSTNRQFNGA